MLKHTILLAAVAGLVFALAPAAQASLVGELGILDTSGNNPATGAPWAYGDQYRLAFITSTKIDATSYDISTYNSDVQTAANNGMAGLSEATWKAIISTRDDPETTGVDETVDARDNTNTNPNVVGSGHSIFLVDGTTKVFDNFDDLWDPSIEPANDITLTENGTATSFGWPHTGSYGDGTESDGAGGSSGEVQQGRAGEHGTYKGWIYQAYLTGPRVNELDTYALSEPLTVIPEPATMALLGLGGLGLILGRKRK